jgi:uncharacterized membrane protein YagU involved in acid resistance
MSNRHAPLGALARGLAAGVAGTALMTAAQVLPSKLQSGGEEEGDPQPSWDEALVPALVARRIGEGVFKTDVPEDRIPLLTNVMHWGYGTGWGVVYGLLHSRRSERPLRSGVAFGVAVWAMSYLQLVPMGLYQPPWEYSAKELSMEIGYHLAYGAGVGLGHRVVA